jgi:uncharacterized protein YndB with AHSA1/START domain
MQNAKDDISTRELIFSRLLNAPIDLVWEVWTDPEHVQLWWGPDGFTNIILKMEPKNGGEWDLIMKSPDGIDYKHRCVFREVIKNKRIVYEQFTHPKYVATVDFESKGDKTYLRWHLLFESRDYLIEAAKTFKVDIGLIQTAERLIHYLSQLNTSPLK